MLLSLSVSSCWTLSTGPSLATTTSGDLRFPQKTEKMPVLAEHAGTRYGFRWWYFGTRCVVIRFSGTRCADTRYYGTIYGPHDWQPLVRIWRQLKEALRAVKKSSCRLYSDLIWEINSDQRKSKSTKKEPKRACCATRVVYQKKKHFSDCIDLWMWQRIKGGTLLNLVIFPPKCYFLLSWEITTEKSLSLTDISIKTWLTSKLSKNPTHLYTPCAFYLTIRLWFIGQATRTRSANFDSLVGSKSIEWFHEEYLLNVFKIVLLVVWLGHYSQRRRRGFESVQRQGHI